MVLKKLLNRTSDVLDEEFVDPTGWMLSNAFADFLIMHTAEIKYLCMFGYTFYHGALDSISNGNAGSSFPSSHPCSPREESF